MTPQEKTDLKNRINDEAAKSVWGCGVHFLGSSVANVIDSMPEAEITLDQAWNKIAEGYPQSTQKLQNAFKKVVDAVNAKNDMHIVNGNTTLEWPSKEPAKVPQWFYDWVTIGFGNMKRHAKVAEMYRQLYCGGVENYQYDWIEHNTQTAINAILYGCEPIEPLYIMPVPYTEEAYYFEISLIGVPKPAKKWEAQKFTLAEINEYFPKIAEFKEEVAE